MVKVTLLCTSDVHGYYMPWDYSEDKLSKKGGLTRVSTVYKQLKKENPNTFIMDNGDLIQGNSVEYLINEERFPGILAINEIGYEIFSMGNHEFNFGMDKLIHITKQFKGESMMGNLYRKKNNIRFMNGVYYINIDNIRIGFVSLNTPLVRIFEQKNEHLKDYDIVDADVELEKLLNKLENCDAVIGIFHMGDFNENNIPNTGATDLLNNVRGANKINAIFAGHMHKVVNKKLNNTIFLEPGYHAEALSRLDLYFDSSRERKLVNIEGSIININDSIESDIELEKKLEPYHFKLREYANELMGYVTEDLIEEDEVKGIPQVRVAQTKIFDFFIEALINYSKSDVLAIHFDNPYPKITLGEVKRKDINLSYSYSGGEISNYKITGEQLKRYMEWSAEVYNKSKVGDVNISFNPERTKFKYSTHDIFGNIKYQIDIRQDVGNRIKNLRYKNDEPIHPTDVINLGVNKYRMDYLTSSNGIFAGEEIKLNYSTIRDTSLGVRGTIRSLVGKYIKELPNQTYSPHKTKMWDVIMHDEYKEYIDLAIELINNGLLNFNKDKKGNNDLTTSLNIFDEVNEIQKIRKKYNIKTDSKILKDILEEILINK